MPKQLDHYDAIIADMLATAVGELQQADAVLADALGERDRLAGRVHRLRLALGQDPEEPLPEMETAARTIDEEPALPTVAERLAADSLPREDQQGPGRRLGQLWADVEEILGGQKRAIQSSSLYKKLLDEGYEDSETFKTRYNKSLARWTKSGHLERPKRGLYRLGAPKPQGKASKPAAAVKPPTTASKDDSSTQTIDAEALWAIVATFAKNGPVGSSDLLNTLAAEGWDFSSEAAKTSVHNKLGYWAKTGKLVRIDRGIYGLPAQAKSETAPAEPRTDPAKPKKPSKALATSTTRIVETEALWALVKNMAKNGPMGTSDLLNTLAAEGWAVGTDSEKNAVYNRLRAWVTKGDLVRIDRGIYGLAG